MMKTLFRILLLSLALTLIAACTTSTPIATPTNAPVHTPTPEALVQGTEGFPWWNDAVFYEIFVRSFNDSDGDGIGDFNGITEKLDYLEELGIRGLWLMPINPSPSYHGYDVTDYYAVNPDYGTMEDFTSLLEEAHKRGIRIIIDLVLNHSSSQHPWFKSALEPGGEHRDWYVWRAEDPGTPGPWGQKAWYRASNSQYYYAIFWDQMPDLNYGTQAVRDEAREITAFWLEDVGIDGFRLDAVRYLVEDERLADSSSNHGYLKEWGEYYRSLNPQAFAVGEAWTDNANVKEYTRTDDELDAAFNFDLSTAILKSLNESNNTSVRFLLQTTVRDFPQQDNANFITNHDMPRVPNQLGQNHEGKSRAAAGILLTAPGIPFIYYGEEIGMSGTKPDELIRTPMQWSAEEYAGFTEGTPWQPVNSDFESVNVADQQDDVSSLLEHYRTLIGLRNDHPALRIGKTFVAESDSRKLVSYMRASQDEIILVVVNIDDEAVTDYDLELGTGPLAGSYEAVSLLDAETFAPVHADEQGGFDGYAPLPEIPAYAVIVIRLEPQP